MLSINLVVTNLKLHFKRFKIVIVERIGPPHNIIGLVISTPKVKKDLETYLNYYVKPAGIVFLYRKLPWWECWFKNEKIETIE
jgi:hypothetical protein